MLLLNMKHILIVSYNWPPRNAIGTHRPYSWAKYLSLAGYRVTVLTSIKQIFDEPLDLCLPPLPNVTVVEVPYGLKSLSRTRGSQSFFISASRMLVSFLKDILPFELDFRRGWRAASRGTIRQLAHQVDCLISTYGPSASHLIAFDIKKINPRLRWIADYRDLWSCNPVSIGNQIQAVLSRFLERRTVMQYADEITVVSSDMKYVISSRFKRNSIVVPNGFDEDDFQVKQRLLNTSRNSRDNEFRFVYTGTIYPRTRDPFPLLTALVDLRNSNRLTRHVLIEFYGSRLDPIKKYLSYPDFKDFIRVYGHVPREQALNAQRTADALLLLESSEKSASGVVTGKIYEYMTSGIPTLCIGSDPDYEIGRLLTSTRTGLVYGPRQYNELPQLVSETLLGRGLYSQYDPQVDTILSYSRKSLTNRLASLL
jgi:hypothetical protein